MGEESSAFTDNFWERMWSDWHDSRGCGNKKEWGAGCLLINIRSGLYPVSTEEGNSDTECPSIFG